jgi:hypothetical protein
MRSARPSSLREMRLPLRAALLLLAGTAACRDSTGPLPVPLGRYELVSIDGERLPHQVFGTEVHSGSVVLRGDRTYIRTSTGLQREDGELVMRTDLGVGTYRGTRARLQMQDEGGTEYDATIDGLRLTIDGGSVLLAYELSP